ncbi:Putative Ig domain-containing protein [Dyella jiangningensis]|uniref:putative Ig domain-containing protein n=1 Tax=Dyella sp. AtDHG13 TaxID=1938897 RepID=UPI00088D9AFC|nr:putative Ig domain-containing protein [Dyella sp. AtDHG13]PXV59883.1 putative Ig domain-containing protein [Dyella sp. AtDHG13]SDJ19002.1 Putative Ig domain-containing protein [Dyella jiangningensis]
MHHRPWMRAAVRLMSLLRSPHAWALTLLLVLLVPGASHAQTAPCTSFTVPNANTTPSTSPMAAGTQIVIDATGCDSGGGLTSESVATAHGHVSVDPLSDQITYLNNNDGATTDTFTFKDDFGRTVTVTVLIAARATTLPVSPSSLANPQVGVPYSATISTTNGTGPYTYSLTGSLPPGLTFASNAVNATISGTATTSGTSNITINVTDSAGGTGVQSYAMTVAAPQIVTNPVPNAVVNVAYSQTLTASGGTAPYTFSLESGSLPAGLSLNTSTGVISGTPTTVGSATFGIRATDSSPGPGGPYFTVTSLTINVQNPPPVANAVNATVAYGSTSNPIALNITGGTATSVAVGTNATHGTATASGTSITYTPVVGYAGPDSFTYTASNTGGTSSPATVTVTVSPPTITYAPAAPTHARAGVAYSQSIASASGGKAPYTYALTTGSLPAGITLGSNGTLSGTPTAVGTFAFTVTATDSSTGTGPFSASPASVTLVVDAPSLALSPGTLPDATLHTAYAQTVTGSGGTAPYAYSVSAGALPPGLSLSSSGVLSGTPTTNGSYNFSIAATDATTGAGAPFAATQAYSMTVSSPTIVLSPASLPVSTVATAYSQAITASGGTAPYTFAVTSGSLPAGLTLSGAGMLSGTPTAGGSFSFTVTATDANTNAGSQSYSLTVNAATVTVNPGSLPSATDGVPYSQILSSTGGTPPYTFSVTGSLPPGMTLASNGTLSGAPTGTGTYSFIVQAMDSSTGTGPYSGARPYSITVAAPTLGLAPAGTALSGTYGQPYSQTFTATNGTGPYTYAETGTLPAGMAWNAATGTLSGTPTQSGSFPITVTATDSSTGAGAPFNVSTFYTLTIAAATINLTPTSAPAGATGASYNLALTANGGIAPYTFAISSGALPAGMSLSSAGNLAGTPTSAGTFAITVKATDAHGVFGMQAYSLVINAPTVTLAPSSVPAATAETAYSQTLTASGGTSPYTYTISSGALPPGLSLSSAGVLSGTPTAAGSYNFSVRALDSSTGTGAPFVVTQNYSLTVNAPVITLSPAALNPMQLGTAFSQQLSASGGNGSYTYAVSAGVLPTGVTMSSTGLLAGTPTAGGSFSFTVTARDSAGFGGSQAYSTTIGAPSMAVSPANLPAMTAESSYAQTLSATGGTAPYTFVISAGALPAGLSLSPAGVLSGTPTVSGTFNVTVLATDSSTGTGAPFSATRSYALIVNAPGITVSPGALSAVQTGVAFHQQLSASGGNGSYTFTVSAGSLPTGLSLSSSGALTGTPTAAGSYAFSISAKDSLGFSGTQSFTVSVAQPAPVVVNDTASTNANTAATIPVTANDTGPITSIAVTRQPTHGTATVNGLNVVYTPADNYFGTDSLNYTATGPGGTSTAATVSITVAAGAVPAVAPQAVTVLSGKSVTINIVASAPVGPFFNPVVVTPPTSGTVVAQGYTFVYTAAADASGTYGFDFTISNVFGASRPAHVTVTVNPMPVAPTLSATVVAGKSIQVDLTATAHGGPFTGARLVSVSPANAGSASIQASAGGYQLSFTAAPAFSGAAQLSYTLSNAYAESEPGTINVSVTPRSDPSKDAEVLGVLDAQADAARRVAIGQIGNFQRRLESLHGGAAASGFSNGITMTSASSMRRPDSLAELGGPAGMMNRYRVQPDADDTAAAPPKTTLQGGSLPGDVAVWTGGAINFGKMQPGSSDNGIDFTTSGLSMGVDKAFSSSFAAGLGVGYGHDASDVGQHNSRSMLDSYNVAMYASFHPANSVYVDGLLGYQWLQFDARRYVTDDGNTVHGSRGGTQFFGSISVGYEHQTDNVLLTPYGRLDIAHGHLDGYTESGDATYALAYQRQTVKTSTGTLGFLAQWVLKRDYGTWSPQLRVEYGHDMQGSNQASMRYADVLSGPLYQATLTNQSRNHTMLGAGVALQTLNGWLLRMEYQNYMDNTSSDNQSILLGVEKKFEP